MYYLGRITIIMKSTVILAYLGLFRTIEIFATCQYYFGNLLQENDENFVENAAWMIVQLHNSSKMHQKGNPVFFKLQRKAILSCTAKAVETNLLFSPKMQGPFFLTKTLRLFFYQISVFGGCIIIYIII